MRTSFWDFLSTIFFLATLILAAVFTFIYQYPDSRLNPFPPPTEALVVQVPTLTPSPIALPDIWTPAPTELPDEMAETPVDFSMLTPTITNTPVLVQPTASGKTQSPTPIGQPKSPGISLPTRNPLAPTGVKDLDKDILTITAPIGVFDNTWQNIQSIPSFSWGTSKSIEEIDHFLLYFGTKQNGRLSINTAQTHFNRASVPSGIYYFRLVAIGKNGKIIGSPSSFLFKYDDQSPSKPRNLQTTSTSDTERPYFSWSDSIDAHSGMIGGMAGYAIYQGTAGKCGKPVAFTSVSHWMPVFPMTKGVTEYFCVRAVDAIGNESDWAGPVSFTYTG